MEFIKGQDQEGLRWKDIVDKDGNAVDFSGASQIKFYVYSQDGSTLLFEGTLGSEISVTGASNNNIEWAPSATDFDNDVGSYKGELKVTHSTGRIQKIHDLIVKIVDDSPTS